MTRVSNLDKLKDLQNKQNAMKNRIASLEAKIKNDEDRKLTRKKILVGAFFLEKYKNENDTLSLMLNDFLVRDSDRVLFDLKPLS